MIGFVSRDPKAMLSAALTLSSHRNPKPNPDYRDDWKQLHDEAHKRRQEALVVRNDLIARLHEPALGDQDARVANDEKWDAAHRLCMECLDTFQHRTFEDALDWANRTFCVEHPVSVANLQDFRDVKHLISAAYDKHRRAMWLRKARKNVIGLADPSMFAPFAGAQTWLSVEPAVYFGGREWGPRREARFTTCKVGDTLHVAMQSLGPIVTVINDCELLIEEYLRQEIPEWTNRKWFVRETMPTIQFYTYVAPTDAIVEMFDRVGIEPQLTAGKPVSITGWKSVGCVPAALRPDWLPGGLAPIAAQVPSESE